MPFLEMQGICSLRTKSATMLQSLQLLDFKNFENATLKLGPLTVLIGANATGKSNIRDAFRLLHGLARGYTVAEAVGEKWGEGGVLQWTGIRGGLREAARWGESVFELHVRFNFADQKRERKASYGVAVEIQGNGRAPIICGEWLIVDGYRSYVFDSHPEGEPIGGDAQHILVRVRKKARGQNPAISFLNQTSVLYQVCERSDLPAESRELARLALHALSDLRFMDLEPKAMRQPSYPGQLVLGDRGENLSSVLQAICSDDEGKATLLSWLQELTPMDCADLDFAEDSQGKVLLKLLEQSGSGVTAHSASDGTLRFLAILAALLGPQPARFYFIEEFEVGIHPTRLSLLLQLIEAQVRTRPIQLVVSTHSPWLLQLLSEESLEHTSLTYRLPGQPNSKIKLLLELPGARQLLSEQELSRLHAAGWLEDAVFFEEGKP